MSSLFYSYFYNFIHPFESSGLLRLERNGSGQPGRWKALTLYEAISLSWIAKIISSLYGILAIVFGYHISHLVENGGGLVPALISGQGILMSKLIIFSILLEVVFFPLTTWIYLKLWSVIIEFFAKLYQINDQIEEATQQIITLSLSSSLFFLIPIFGELAKNLSQVFLIFAGLKRNLQMTTAQGLVVIISPLFLLFLACVLVILYVVMLFNII